MGLWGVTPVFVAALLGTAVGSHPVPFHDVADHSFVRVVSSSPSPVLSTTTAVLRQVAPDEYQTTVLVDDVAGGCAAGQPKKDDYSLETTGPPKTLPPTSLTSVTGPAGSPVSGAVATSARAISAMSPAQQTITAAFPAAASGPPVVSCEVTLDFAGLPQVPESATLVLDGSSSVQLTVSRDVTLFDYLAIPAIVGGSMALLLLILSILFVRGYDFPRRGRRWWRREFWNHPVSATAVWTLNDSWATNITSVAAAIGSIYGITTAANSIFPGVALDRFAILVAFPAAS